MNTIHHHKTPPILDGGHASKVTIFSSLSSKSFNFLPECDKTSQPYRCMCVSSIKLRNPGKNNSFQNKLDMEFQFWCSYNLIVCGFLLWYFCFVFRCCDKLLLLLFGVYYSTHVYLTILVAPVFFLDVVKVLFRHARIQETGNQVLGPVTTSALFKDVCLHSK